MEELPRLAQSVVQAEATLYTRMKVLLAPLLLLTSCVCTLGNNSPDGGGSHLPQPLQKLGEPLQKLGEGISQTIRDGVLPDSEEGRVQQFGSLEGHHSSQNKTAHFPDWSARRSQFLVKRRLILLAVGGTTLTHGLGYILGSGYATEKLVRGGMLCSGAQRITTLLGFATTQLAALQLLFVWFADDRAVKCAIRLTGVCLALGTLLITEKVALEGWEMRENIGALIFWPLLAMSCYYYGRQF